MSFECKLDVAQKQHLAEVVGFEPTELLHSSVFKTAALNHAQPHFLVEFISKYRFKTLVSGKIQVSGHVDKIIIALVVFTKCKQDIF